MKKAKYLILLLLVILPIKVLADDIGIVTVGGSAPNFKVNGENAYCITPGKQSPGFVNSVSRFGDNNLDMAYLGAYRMSLILPESSWLPNEYRTIIAQKGIQAYATRDALIAESLGYVYNQFNPYLEFNWPVYSTKLACSGFYAAGRTDLINKLGAYGKCRNNSRLSECTDANSWYLKFNDCTEQIGGIDAETLAWIKYPVSSFYPTFMEDTTKSNKETWEFTYKLTGTGYDNITKLLNSPFWALLKAKSKIVVTDCEIVNNADINAGFSCSVLNKNNNLLDNNEVTIKISNSKNNNVNQTLGIRLKYNYDFPFNGTGLKIYKGSPLNQDLMVISSDPEIKTVNTTVDLTSYECKIITDNNVKKYIYQNKEVSVKEYINKCGCDDISLDDVKEDKDYYNKTCLNETSKPLKCEFKDNKYYNNGKEVSLEDYLDVGCCTGVTVDNVKNNMRAKELYQNMCTANDTVYIENECGARTKLGKEEYVINNGINVNLLSCKNESYIDYTHSYVWQLPMSKVMERVEKVEFGAESLEGIWNNSGLSSYIDKSYMTSNISGKDGKTLNGISSDNNYCMLLTSENNDIYFPGTAIASSGRFFVFNELNNEECLNSINPGANCFRQPYIEGKIDLVMHTNFEKWNSDYKAAIEKEIEAYNAYQEDKTINKEQIYKVAKAKRENLEKYKTECEARNDLDNYWSYNLSPELKFSYAQKVYGGKERSSVIKETVDMVVSKENVRYWPNISTEVSCDNVNHSKGNDVSYQIKYGDVYLTKKFTSVEDYSTKCTQKIYYRPKQATYSTIPSGEYILDEARYQTGVSMLHNGIEIGYVYNVRLTTYEGTYTTSFSVDKLGHQSDNGISSVQLSVDKYKKDNNISELTSECVYCNQEGEFKRVCQACDEPELSPSFVYRTISLNNVNPNNRVNSNWTDEKGASAKERIEALSGDSVVAVTNNSESNIKQELLARGNIYDDSTKEYLEYEFNLTSRDMQLIKKNTSKSNYIYGDLTICGSNGKVTEKDTEISYCYVCNEDGKECESSFVDAFSNTSTTLNTRKNKWKYFINGKWEFGNWKDIIKNYSKLEGFEDGRYPDPIKPDAYLKKYYNWP